MFEHIENEPFALGFLAEPSENLTKKTAAGFLAQFAVMKPRIDPKTGLADCDELPDADIRYFFGYGVVSFEKFEKKMKRHPEYADEYRELLRQMHPYFADEAVEEFYSEEDRLAQEYRTCWGGNWFGHAVPNFIDFAKYGTDGLREKVHFWAQKNPQSAEFYEGLLTYLDAFDLLGQRIRESAEELLPTLTDPDEIRKVSRLARTFAECPKKPAKTFADAVGVFVEAFSVESTDSPGHFDQYMIDYWRASDPVESREVLDDLWQYFHDTRAWNLCISGSDENGNDLTNELSYEILALTEKYHYQTPNLTMRCHPNTPIELYRAAARALATGCGLPGLYNDLAVCPALERLGIPPEDSHRYVMNGCNQIDIQGKSHMGLEDGEVNIGKAVELALNDGVCTVSGKALGSRTGDPKKFASYEEFYRAVRTQIHFLTRHAVSMSLKSQMVLADLIANPMRSLTIEGCLEKGLEYKNKGPLYGHGQILIEGLADCVDSVIAVKKFVFEEHRFSMERLVDAVHADFEGYEDVYDVLRNSKYRFGNDIEEVDAVAADIVNDYNRFVMRFPTFRGGFFSGGCSPFERAEENARQTGALPSGKRFRKGLYADSIGAVPGKDICGPTALLSSCLRFDHTLPGSGFILNVKFDKAQFGTEKGMENFIALLRAYFEGGGQQLSVAVLSEEELRDAVIHPEDHKDLVVRVGGYSDYFVNLTKELQQNVIGRTSLSVGP